MSHKPKPKRKSAGSDSTTASPPAGHPSPPGRPIPANPSSLALLRLSSSFLPPLAAHLLLLSLPPIFGSSPAHLHTHATVLFLALPLLAILPSAGPTASAVAKWLLAGLCAGASHWVWLVGQWSGELGCVVGPGVAWAGVGVLGMVVVRDDLLDGLAQTYARGVTKQGKRVEVKPEGLVGRLQIASIAAGMFWSVEKAWGWVLPRSIDSHIFEILKLVALLLFLSTMAFIYSSPRSRPPSTPSQTKPARFPIPTILLPLALLPILLSLPLSAPPHFPDNITLSKTHSRTGLIIVGETRIASGQRFRYLRADHSLLGGRWIVEGEGGDEETSEEMRALVKGENEKSIVGESIFSAFVLQEGVRLVKREMSKEGKQEKALVIGLGVGIAARSLALHNLSTTIVEYDPAVYVAARDHFFLPEPEEVFLEDANAFVQREGRNGMYDLVVHDVFTGGSVPGELFSEEFWSDLRALMSENSALAVNFAGIQKTESASLVIRTLLRVFPACRGFRDALGESTDTEDGALKNLVIFCTPLIPPVPQTAQSVPRPDALTFRPPVKEDFLGSYLRRKILSEFEQHEVDLALFGSVRENLFTDLLKRGEAGKLLNKLQKGSGVATFKAMRELMPVEVWNSW